jgi:two-component system, OmpR family, KDP operon response regulator KdpE
VTDVAKPDLRPEILLIEDDPETRRKLRAILSGDAYRIHESTSVADGLARIARRPPDAILLELALPDADGLEVILHVRLWSKTLPIIVLSTRRSESDKIIALDAGADDFVDKPFAAGELMARIRVALRRKTVLPKSGDSTVFRSGDLEVDFSSRRVLLQGKEVRLTRTEYKLLQVLILHADQVLTHSQLLNEVWGPNYGDQSHYVRVYMGQLRLKLEADPARPRYLRTEPGVGYRLMTR